MYLKLACRNAKRSTMDYLLYSFTVTILVSIMCVSNCISALGNMEASFQTVSLPLLIVFIMVVLIDYINTFMLKQRSKELATYMLLGMEKGKLSLLFLLEFIIIGMVCFLLGVLIGIGILALCFAPMIQVTSIPFRVKANGVFQTLAYFCMVEFISFFGIKQKLCKLQINQLMNEKRRNQSIAKNNITIWRTMLMISFLSSICLLYGVAFLPNAIASIIASFIMIPIMVCVLAFYKWIYAHFSSKRLLQPDDLYQGDLLYQISEITTGTKTSAIVNSIFCICLLFSAMSFAVGTLMLTGKVNIFASENQQWMGFLQISICIIFMVIYFSVLSLMQIIELKQQANNIQILHYMGRNKEELKLLVKTQILIKLFMPTLMCFVLLCVGTPLINYKLNSILPITSNNSLLFAIGGFIVCFILFYLCYFFIVYIISRRCIKALK